MKTHIASAICSLPSKVIHYTLTCIKTCASIIKCSSRPQVSQAYLAAAPYKQQMHTLLTFNINDL